MMSAADLAERLGLRRHPKSWRGRCPACDYSSTFSIRTGRNGQALLYCASCRNPDALSEAAARAMGRDRQPDRYDNRDVAAIRQRKQDTALRLWRGSESAVCTLADRYLTARGLAGVAASTALHFRADTPHPEGGRLPAMIALVSDVARTPLGIHRTYLARDGSKARLEPTKASLGPVWSGAIRLDEIAPDAALIVGEGIESSASAGRLMGLPAWAAISAGNLAKGLMLPPEARHVVIAADPDEAGKRAARDAWLRWRAEGRNVQIATPDAAGDFNDLLRAREAGNG